MRWRKNSSLREILLPTAVTEELRSAEGKSEQTCWQAPHG